MELEGRARSMVGSVDLWWRSQGGSEIILDQHFKTDDDGGPRNGPQGRMITGFGGSSSLSQPSSFSVKTTLSKIPYNHSISKERVLVPRYHYNGGPKMTSMILRQCWRRTILIAGWSQIILAVPSRIINMWTLCLPMFLISG